MSNKRSISMMSGCDLAAIEVELEAVERRLLEIGELAARAPIVDRALKAGRAVFRFRVGFVEFMSDRLTTEESAVWQEGRREPR